MPWSHGVTFLGTSAPLMIVIVMLFFQILLTVHKSIVRPPCSGLVLVLQSEERPDRELMLYAGVVEQRLLLKLLQLLCVEAEGVRPEVGARVDEGRAQRLSGEWVHKWRLCQSWWGDHLLGFADLRVRFRKLQSDGLGQVGIEPHSLLEVLLRGVGAGPRVEGDEANRAGRLPVL